MSFTPLARAALAYADLSIIDLPVPAGCTLTGWGKSSNGPFTFMLTDRCTGQKVIATAATLPDVRDAVYRVLGDNALEEQLRASLERIG